MNSSRIAKVRAHSEHLLDLMIGLKEKYALLHPMVFDLNLAFAIGSNKAAWGFAIIRNNLLFGCLQDLAKLALDEDRRTPSVANIMEALEEPAVRAELREAYASWGIGDKDQFDDETQASVREFEEREQSVRRSEFDRHFEQLVDSWTRLRDSPELAKCRTVRDKLLAHSELRHDGLVYKPLDMASLDLRWVEIQPLVLLLQQVVSRINLITRSSSFAFDALDAQFADAVAAFWPRIKR